MEISEELLIEIINTLKDEVKEIRELREKEEIKNKLEKMCNKIKVLEEEINELKKNKLIYSSSYYPVTELFYTNSSSYYPYYASNSDYINTYTTYP